MITESEPVDELSGIWSNSRIGLGIGGEMRRGEASSIGPWNSSFVNEAVFVVFCIYLVSCTDVGLVRDELIQLV